MAGAKDEGSGSATDNSCPGEGGDGESGSDWNPKGNLSEGSSEEWTPSKKGSGKKPGKKMSKKTPKVNCTGKPWRPWEIYRLVCKSVVQYVGVVPSHYMRKYAVRAI